MRTRRTFHPDRVGRTPARQTPARTERRDMLRGVADDAARSELTMSLDELAREGARRMLAGALEAEVDVYLAAFAELVDEHGHRLVRRNGHAPARQVAEVGPLLYLHGLSSSDFVPALTELFGSAAGLSASVVTRLTTQWQAEREAFGQRDLSEVDDVYCWADGVHFSIRLGEQGRLCCLVIVGVRADGRKELVAVADGTRESTEDWAELLRDLRRRGMGAPVVMWATGRWGCGGR